MDLAEVSKFEQKVGNLKVSELVRRCGYGDPKDYSECVLGRAYEAVTGRSLVRDGFERLIRSHVHGNHYVEQAAAVLGIPYDIARKAEYKCFDLETPDQIADWLEAQGL